MLFRLFILISGWETQAPLFQMRVVDGVCRYIDSDGTDDDGPVYLDALLDHPLYTEAVDTALSLCEPEHGTPLHVKIVLEWDSAAKLKFVALFLFLGLFFIFLTAGNSFVPSQGCGLHQNRKG